jgi:hypothetical protein
MIRAGTYLALRKPARWISIDPVYALDLNKRSGSRLPVAAYDQAAGLRQGPDRAPAGTDTR